MKACVEYIGNADEHRFRFRVTLNRETYVVTETVPMEAAYVDGIMHHVLESMCRELLYGISKKVREEKDATHDERHQATNS